jgi:phospholipid/cholesterol/gamma-HCH transport system substrate-binding protein
MSNEVKVGTFVITALIIFIVTFIRVANVQLRGERVPYKTYFKHAGGLEPGTAVRFAGLQAGVITDVKPAQEDPTQIEVSMEMSDTIPVNELSVAKLASLSALSENYLEITPGTKEARRLEPGATIPSEEVVTLGDITQKIADTAETATELMKKVQSDFDEIFGETQVLLKNLQELTGEKNQRSVEQLLANSNRMIEQQMPKLDRITDQVSDVLAKIDTLTTDLREVAQNSNDAVKNVNRTIDETREPIKKDLAELEVTLARARAVMEDIQALVLQNEGNINETMENFRVASENVEQLTDQLRQRPWSLIRVQPKPDRQVPVPAAAGANR